MNRHIISKKAYRSLFSGHTTKLPNRLKIPVNQILYSETVWRYENFYATNYVFTEYEFYLYHSFVTNKYFFVDSQFIPNSISLLEGPTPRLWNSIRAVDKETNRCIIFLCLTLRRGFLGSSVKLHRSVWQFIC